MNHLPTLALRPAGWLASRDARLRILAAVSFALVTVSMNQVPTLLLAFAAACALIAASGLSARVLLRRLIALEGLMAVILITLPFTVPGETWFGFGPLEASWEGTLRALTIVLKAHSIVLALLALVGGIEPVALGHALSRLRLPDKLVHLFLFTVRYIDVLHEEYRRLRMAMRTRAFVARSDRHTWNTLGWLVGMLLVRSLERSRRIVAAMKCRGFHGRLYLLDTTSWQPADSHLAVFFGLVVAALLGFEHLS
ncbi:MAG: cobalt ECF transporter T component CbiQ [Pseudomonadota bacterium]|nr:cobalt ECF transporter T component CbiQ [Pseudomonadota bacterium]